MLEPTDIKKLFAVLQAHYGHKWTTAYDDPQIMSIAVSEWHRVLRGFRPEDIRKGLETWAGEWPPTLPEFARCCLPPLEEIGYDIDTQARRMAPSYYYESQTAHEESIRLKRYEEVRKDVEEKILVEVLREIQTQGVESLLIESKQPNNWLEGNG